MADKVEKKAGGLRGRRRRIWVLHVAVEADKLEMRLAAAEARGDLDASQRAVVDGIRDLLQKARAAAFRVDPVPGWIGNWWNGTLVEAAYRNLHAARVQMIDLYDRDQLRAEIPIAVARANATLHRDDPRRVTVAELDAEPLHALRPRLRRLVADSYEKLDLEHNQLRSFRNILVLITFFVFGLTALTLYVVSRTPNLLPLCFANEVATAQAGVTGTSGLNCPSGNALPGPVGNDVLIVAMLGALGGALTAALSIRNLRGTSNPYDVPVALAMLKVPLGALTAILALVAIQGRFVPGLSVLDSQGQILAYALVFGFAQQALSRLLDKQAQNLLEGLPGGDNVQPLPPGAGRLAPPAEATGPASPDQPPTPPPLVPAPRSEDAVPVAPPAPAADAADERPVDEPADSTQEQQHDYIRDTVNARKDMDEQEEAGLLQAEFGPPDGRGIYGSTPV